MSLQNNVCPTCSGPIDTPILPGRQKTPRPGDKEKATVLGVCAGCYQRLSEWLFFKSGRYVDVYLVHTSSFEEDEREFKADGGFYNEDHTREHHLAEYEKGRARTLEIYKTHTKVGNGYYLRPEYLREPTTEDLVEFIAHCVAKHSKWLRLEPGQDQSVRDRGLSQLDTWLRTYAEVPSLKQLVFFIQTERNRV